MKPVKKDSRGNPRVTATPSTITTTCEYYLMIRSPSESSGLPRYNKHILPLDPRLQIPTNLPVDTLDEHQVAAIENVIDERNARTVDAGEWILSALSMTEGYGSGSFKFTISFRHCGLAPDCHRRKPVVEVVDGKRKEGQRGSPRDPVEAVRELAPETPESGNDEQQPFQNFLPNSDLESSLASNVSPRYATPSTEQDHRSSTPTPKETRTRAEIQVDELDRIEGLACKVLESLHNQSRMHPDHKKAMDVLVRVLDARKKLMGKEHPKTLMTLVHLAYNGHAVPQYSHFGTRGCLMAIKDANVGLMKVLGDKHPDTLMSLHALAIANERCEDFNAAVHIFGNALKGRAEVLGKTHENTLDTMKCLARARDRLGWKACSKEVVESLLECQTEALGRTHAATLDTMEHLANIYARDNLLKEAEACMSSLFELRKEVSDPKDCFTSSSMCFLADIGLKRLQL